jgi:hypothetical protein
LTLEFLVQLADMALEVAGGGHGGLNVPIEIGFLLTQFEELLGVFEQEVFLDADFFFKQLALLVVFLVLVFGHFLLIFDILSDGGFIFEPDFLVVIFMLSVGESLLLVLKLLLVG